MSARRHDERDTAHEIANRLDSGVNLRGSGERIESVSAETVAAAIFAAGNPDHVVATVEAVSGLLIGEWAGVNERAVIAELESLIRAA